ncbi:MAG: hypothetical protein QOF56_360, partial [Acidobacteriaceae bacterium]|nr:hypothetical protein [Acidobacteriaceae bacterium]
MRCKWAFVSVVWVIAFLAVGGVVVR